MLSHTENRSLEQAFRAKTKNLSSAFAKLRFFCRRAAPRQKAPPRGAASQRRSVGFFVRDSIDQFWPYLCLLKSG